MKKPTLPLGPIGTELRKRNIPIIPLHKFSPILNITQAGYGHKQQRQIASDINCTDGYLLSLNKEATNQLLARVGIPVPTSERIKSEKQLLQNLKKLTYPIVIKPTDSLKSRGVFTNINSEEDALKFYRRAKKKFSNILLEEHIEGDDHRILILNDKMIAARKHTAPEVTGDGRHSIKELIEIKNKKREREKKKGGLSKGAIKTDHTTTYILKSQGYSSSSIPKVKIKVKISVNTWISLGGDKENITSEVHPQTIALCREITRLLGLKIAGVDVISPDISEPLANNGGKINEVNSNPFLPMHMQPYLSNKHAIDTVGMFIDYLFPNPKDAWIPIKINNKICTKPEIIEKHYNDKPRQVMMLKTFGSKQKVITKNPPNILLAYLLDPLTTAIDM
ncbi:hypothetical protein ACFL2B_01650 [Patescibacteria group bacterium]